VKVSGYEMGRVGAELLLNSLSVKRSGPSKEIRVPEDLVVRGSTAPPPGAASNDGKVVPAAPRR
jgi:DNA-binding LacI/PurR family transcriptional regulator